MKRSAPVRVLLGAAMLWSVGLSGCEGRPDNARSFPGLSGEESARLPKPALRAAQPAPVVEDKVNEPDPFVQPSEDTSGTPDPGSLMAPKKAESAPPATGMPEQPEKAKADARDLGQELKAALGQPVDCLDLTQLPPSGGTIRVNVGAYVGPSGRITRAIVTAAGQPAATMACIEKRAVSVRMREPIEDAPRLVSTWLEFDIARAPVPTSPPSPPAD